MNVYVGYDSREDLAYQVCEFSIKNNLQMQVYAINIKELIEKNIYTREEIN